MTPSRTLAVGLGTLALFATACSSDDDGAETTDDEATELREVTIPPERLTPFCEAMIALSETLETNPPDDVTAYIVSVYTDIADEVPAEIEDDFQAVLADLQGEPVPSVSSLDAADGSPDGSVPPTSIEQFDAEGRGPDDDPALRLSSYVDFACRDSANNPGPPATQPQDALETSDDTVDGG